MIIGLGDNDISFIEKEIAFDTKPLFNEINQVLYHPALKKIFRANPEIFSHLEKNDYKKIYNHILNYTT